MKKEYIILAVIIIALSLYLFLHKSDKTYYKLPELSKLDGKEISKIEITQSDAKLELTKKDGKWQIAPEEYPADASKVKGMVDLLNDLTLTDLASESKEYKRYDLEKDKKIAVKAWAADQLFRDFDIGKAATTSQHTFVKLSDDPRVYYASENFRTKFEQTVDKLRDKTVLSFDKNEIREIHLTKGGDTLVLAQKQIPVEVAPSQETAVPSEEPGKEASKESAKQDNTEKAPPEKVEPVWQTGDGKNADKTKVTNLISTMSNLACDAYINGKKKEDFTNPICTLLLKGAKEFTLSIFEKMDEKDTKYPAISSENGYPFFLSDNRAKRILMDRGEILEGKKPEEAEKSTGKASPGKIQKPKKP